MKKKQIMLNLSEEDHRLLNGIRRSVDASASDVLRWALRHYALRGPWPIGLPGGRSSVVPGGQWYQIGPLAEEVES